jgi:hypothetical protein
MLIPSEFSSVRELAAWLAITVSQGREPNHCEQGLSHTCWNEGTLLVCMGVLTVRSEPFHCVWQKSCAELCFRV